MTQLYDVTNPFASRRIINTGLIAQGIAERIDQAKKAGLPLPELKADDVAMLTIEPRSTVYAVAMTDDNAKRLRQLEEKLAPMRSLQVRAHDPKKKAAAEAKAKQEAAAEGPDLGDL